MDHLPAFIAGTMLAWCVRDLELELEAESFDGAEEWATFIVRGKAGTRVRLRVEVLEP